MKTTFKTFLGVALSVMLMMQANTSLAQTPVAKMAMAPWTLLGTRTVDYTLDRDVIVMAQPTHPYKELKFTVKNGTVNMHKCTVHFADGETQDIEFADEVDKKNDGRMLDLKGNTKAISKVTFWYDTKNSSDNKSIIEVWGKK